MSIKLPGIGKKIDQYSYCVALDNKNDIGINIKYEKVNAYNVTNKEQKAFEIRTDTRWPDANKIVEVIKKHLEDGLIGQNVKITEDKQRMYLWFGMDQFTGNIIGEHTLVSDHNNSSAYREHTMNNLGSRFW